MGQVDNLRADCQSAHRAKPGRYRFAFSVFSRRLFGVIHNNDIEPSFAGHQLKRILKHPLVVRMSAMYLQWGGRPFDASVQRDEGVPRGPGGPPGCPPHATYFV